MYGKRRRQYNTFAELYDPDLYAVQFYPNRAPSVYLCFGYGFLRLLPYFGSGRGHRIGSRSYVQAVSDVLVDKNRYRPADRTTFMNVFGLQLCFYDYHSLGFNSRSNSRRQFDYYCTHDDLNAAIADNQLKIRKSLNKEEKQKALFTAWRQCDKTIIILTKRGEKRKFDG
eukprot:COSAG05_NODE_2205_length_3403_cov_2.502421_2_plen_170_part_00